MMYRGIGKGVIGTLRFLLYRSFCEFRVFLRQCIVRHLDWNNAERRGNTMIKMIMVEKLTKLSFSL